MVVFMRHPLTLSWHNWRRYCCFCACYFSDFRLLERRCGWGGGETARCWGSTSAWWRLYRWRLLHRRRSPTEARNGSEMTGTSRAHLTPWWPLLSDRSATMSPVVGRSPTCGHPPAWHGCRNGSCVCCADSLAGWGGNERKRSGNKRAMVGSSRQGRLG